jgi:gamma-glutamylcyclotransferase (GGCT)/AIG2-like uncharacterized protein YtfP
MAHDEGTKSGGPCPAHAEGTKIGANVFCYGSLMFDAVWSRVVAGRYRAAPARVRGYRRFAVLGESYPAVVPWANAEVIGRMYFDVDAADVARLDLFEGAEYRRETVEVELLDPQVDPVASTQLAPHAPRAGAVATAGIYVFLAQGRVAAQAWDASRFGAQQIERFIADYAGGDWPAR